MGWLRRCDRHDHTTRIRHHPVRRAILRRAAVRYADQGWDVVPGACHVGRRYDCGRPSCPTEACHPAVADWESTASRDPQRVARWWDDLPYTILLATGRAFDVVDVSATLGRLAMLGRPMRGPVAIDGDGRWRFLVRPGHGLRPELLGRSDIVLHGAGSWIPAPPSWRIPPSASDWRLGDPYVVQTLLSRAVRLEMGSPACPPRAAAPVVDAGQPWHTIQRVA